MGDQKYRYQVEFQFTGLVPEDQHRRICTKGTKCSNQQQQVFRGPPCIVFCFPLIICKDEKRNTIENCVHSQKNIRQGKSSHPCRFVKKSYCFFVIILKLSNRIAVKRNPPVRQDFFLPDPELPSLPHRITGPGKNTDYFLIPQGVICFR